MVTNSSFIYYKAKTVIESEIFSFNAHLQNQSSPTEGLSDKNKIHTGVGTTTPFMEVIEHIKDLIFNRWNIWT